MLAAKKTSWAIERPPQNRSLNQNINTDVVIIGAGITGILTAFNLAKQGYKVVVLEKKKIASGATHYTTAFITQYVDTDQTELVDLFGNEIAKKVWDSHGRAIDLIERIVRNENIDCEFTRCPAFVYALSEEENQALINEQRILQQWDVKSSFLSGRELKFESYGGLMVPNQAKFHSLKFLFGLSKIVKDLGVEIYEESEALNITGESPIKVNVKSGSVSCDKVIVATYQPFNNPKSVKFKKGMYASYVLGIDVPKNRFAEGLYWDLSNPYNYFRIDRIENQDRMILGGADHRTELPLDENRAYNSLVDYLSRLKIENYTITKKWSGPILEPVDGLALIGEYAPNQYLATGFSGNGMTYAGITALLLTDLIEGKSNDWTAVYDPKRKPTAKQLARKGVDYTGELFGGAVKNLLKFKKEPNKKLKF